MAEGIKDEFDEAQYSAVHFPSHLVIGLINHTVSSMRSTEEYILLEGLCNSKKIEQEDDKMQMRDMDELFTISAQIGKISGLCSLTFTEESDMHGEPEIMQFEEEAEEEVKEAAQPAEGEEGEAPAEEAPPAEEGEDKKPSWDPKKFTWTVSNRKSKGLACLYRDYCGKAYESSCRKAAEFGEGSSDQISAALDDFCKSVVESAGNHQFQQVVFKE